MGLVDPTWEAKELGIEMDAFRDWAMGNLVDNRNRGIFAEWLVGQALGAIGDGEVRHEWDAYDLLYENKIKVEVKASGLSQAWSQDKPSRPNFNIAPRSSHWIAKDNKWFKHEKPERFADVYVFCLHEPERATNENVRDSASWKFWVISRPYIDYKLGGQKTVGTATLDQLAKPIQWSEIKAEVDRLNSTKSVD